MAIAAILAEGSEIRIQFPSAAGHDNSCGQETEE
jgi:hypothetical protein